MSPTKRVYICDPEKNKRCKKTGCYLYGGPCCSTSHVQYAKVDESDKVLVIHSCIDEEEYHELYPEPQPCDECPPRV